MPGEVADEIVADMATRATRHGASPNCTPVRSTRERKHIAPKLAASSGLLLTCSRECDDALVG